MAPPDAAAQSGDVVAQILGVSLEELKELAVSGIVAKVGSDKYNLLGSVRSYIRFLRNKELMPSTQKQIAKHLDMSERNVRDVLNGLAEKHGLDREWWKKSTIEDVRVKYLRDMREKAAGRGGDDQSNLTKQRAQESMVKTAMMRLDYNEKIGALIPAEDAADVIIGWCVVANREYHSGFMKLVGEIQSTYKIDVDNKLVENIAGPTLKRIQDHASDAGRDLAEGSGDIHATQNAANS